MLSICVDSATLSTGHTCHLTEANADNEATYNPLRNQQ